MSTAETVVREELEQWHPDTTLNHYVERLEGLYSEWIRPGEFHLAAYVLHEIETAIEHLARARRAVRRCAKDEEGEE